MDESRRYVKEMTFCLTGNYGVYSFSPDVKTKAVGWRCMAGSRDVLRLTGGDDEQTTYRTSVGMRDNPDDRSVCKGRNRQDRND